LYWVFLDQDRAAQVSLIKDVFSTIYARRGRRRKHSLVYCCVLDPVYRAVAWQRIDQICYIILVYYRFRL
jgi:hypothetical protein